MDKKDVFEIIEKIDASGITHFHLKEEDFEIKLKKRNTEPTPADQNRSIRIGEPVPEPASSEAAPSDAEGASDDRGYVTAPLVGTFYKSPSPDAAPFVKIGDRVNAGDVVCIIEAMKLMNEVKTDVAGRVVSIEQENASPVEFGMKLIGILSD